MEGSLLDEFFMLMLFALNDGFLADRDLSRLLEVEGVTDEALLFPLVNISSGRWTAPPLSLPLLFP